MNINFPLGGVHMGNIVAICEVTVGNASVGSSWLETKVFDPSTPVIDIVKWARNNNAGEGKLIITSERESRFDSNLS